MSCPNHPNVAYVLVGKELVCPQCGRFSSFKPVPTQAELLKENEILKERIKELEQQLDAL